MSAYVVTKTHIDSLVQVALQGPSDLTSTWNAPTWQRSDEGEPVERIRMSESEADWVGATLMGANVDSVLYLYRDSDAHEMLPDWALHGYSYTRPANQLSAIETLKALESFEYQSCEHPEWEASEASRFCQVLRGAAIRALPGYAETAWDIDEDAAPGEPSVQDEVHFQYKGVERIVKPLRWRETRNGQVLIGLEFAKDGVRHAEAVMRSYLPNRIHGLSAPLLSF